MKHQNNSEHSTIAKHGSDVELNTSAELVACVNDAK
jgi:hypothetical protein